MVATVDIWSAVHHGNRSGRRHLPIGSKTETIMEVTKTHKLRAAADYGPLKEALMKHINTFSFEHVFYVADLVVIAKDNGYTEAHLSQAVSTLSRTGYIDRVGVHKKMYQNICHYSRGKNPKPPKAKAQKKPQDAIDPRDLQMNEACMRLWNSFRMPVIQGAGKSA
jgi:hypothetical protein